MQDKHLSQLKQSDLYTVAAVEYRVVKSFSLKLKGEAPVQGILDEVKTLKEAGWDVQLGLDEETGRAGMVATRAETITNVGDTVNQFEHSMLVPTNAGS